jgi:beta-alanine--pyruvate transaminase
MPDGFGRLGAPLAADYFGVKPDLISTAKGLANGCVPMGAVFANRVIHDALMTGPESVIELFHGYTCSGHPVGCAAGLATLEIYIEEMLLTRNAELATQWQEPIHSLRGLSNVIDIRTIGLIAGIELAPREGQPGARAYETFVTAFEKNILIRFTGDVLCPLAAAYSGVRSVRSDRLDAPQCFSGASLRSPSDAQVRMRPRSNYP